MKKQLSFQLDSTNRLVPVYRDEHTTSWVPTSRHSIKAPSDIATPGYMKWKALLATGCYEVISIRR
ncbi:hypothetical protein Lepto7375DRAFT_7183 [Leptolyngbya sp. PCC 7375]|nr:hypothetical protein Lepto7375DRAFT_7183 [Leptolyngbya sp. PCC 7375]